MINANIAHQRTQKAIDTRYRNLLKRTENAVTRAVNRMEFETAFRVDVNHRPLFDLYVQEMQTYGYQVEIHEIIDRYNEQGDTCFEHLKGYRIDVRW